ncbi:MAG: gliding motility-associated C-terminal domain-containing protein [Bacteroidales bacterium]|nr:gliding motility-associated C-terminal domain-containing protein [Bacteroidales bacterium]
MRKLQILFVVFLVFGFKCIAQVDSIKPPMPVFDYCTINLSDGSTTLHWSPNIYLHAPHNPPYEKTIGYVIYKYSSSGSCIGMCQYDTVSSNTFTYTDINTIGDFKKNKYSIAARSITQVSQLTTNHSNIFITSKYDSCNFKIDLTWNLYEGWKNDSTYAYYYLYVSNSPTLNSFTFKDSIYKFTNQYSFKNVIENRDYYFYLTARRVDKPFTTYSNLYHRFTDMPIRPNSMSIDSIIAEDKKVNIYFQIDQATELNHFEVVRWEQSDSVKSIFSKKMLNLFNNPKTNYFGDTVDSWTARTRPFFYKIDAINTCPLVVKRTNLANTIIPKVHNQGLTNHIEWDQLYIDTSLIAHKNNYTRYRVTRYAYTDIAMPPVYLPETDQLEITDDVKIFEGQGYSVKFCYQVEGYERNLLGSIVMLCRSRIQCTEVVPGVVMPDAIIPNDTYVNNGNARNILVPIITYKADYSLSIYNRWGNLVFEGRNTGWNGVVAGGRLAKEGTYVYRLVISTSGNNDLVKTGNVTVIYH